LRALRSRLRNDSSVIIFNNHGNLWSHKALLYPIHKMRGKAISGVSGNYLTHREIVRVADSVGLRVRRFAGCGVLGGRIARNLSEDRAVRWERFLSKTPAWRLGVNQLYIACAR
jgi:hypothetical protein